MGTEGATGRRRLQVAAAFAYQPVPPGMIWPGRSFSQGGM